MNVVESIDKAQCVVIKIGSVLIRDAGSDHIRKDWFAAFAEDIKALKARGKDVVIISSGAVALGRQALGIPLDMPPGSIPLEQKQAASAVGQFHLFAAYYEAFSAVGLQAAQVLLTMSETENRRMHLNARETLGTLLDKGIVPIINENDTVSTGEIRFGDNDRLAVRVAQMIDADLVVLLSTADGLYTADPAKDPQAAHLPVVKKITDEHVAMAGDAIPGLSTGGMKSKIDAAISATRAGIALIIADGTGLHALREVTGNTALTTTLFLAQESRINARKRWLQAHLKPSGSVFVDDGALKALRSGGSLLPIGVKKLEGVFERGDVIEIRTLDGGVAGIGLSAYGAEEARKIIGVRSENIYEALGYAGRDELIHRNDMVLQD